MMIRNRADLREQTLSLFAGITPDPENSIEKYVVSKAFFSMQQTPPQRGLMQHKKRRALAPIAPRVKQVEMPKKQVVVEKKEATPPPVPQAQVNHSANGFFNLLTVNRVALLGLATFCAVKAMGQVELGSNEG